MTMLLQSKSPSNGSSPRKGEREGVSNRAQSIKSCPANTVGNLEAWKGLRVIVYCTSQHMIGHLVEVHLKNGSVYSGIFHAADVEKDFGIVLKMASLVSEGFLRGHKSCYEFVRKPPSKIFIIPADELVQVVAKDLSVFSDGVLNAVPSEKPVELLMDSSISKSHHVDQVKELKPWEPDEDVPQGMENVFDKPGNREWDQFEVNKSLFGVKSTFNEELYTTKLERGAGTKELEEQAQRIAREIEGEYTRDPHVAEERGHQFNEESDIDEETKYSSVRPVDGCDDSGVDEEDDKLLDDFNDQTFGGSSTSDGQKPASSSVKGYEKLQGDSQPSRSNTNVDQSSSISEGAKLGGGVTSGSETAAEKERRVSQVSGKRKSESSFGQPDSRSSESRPAPPTSSQPGLSSSSSIGSMSLAEKSTLNPDTKESRVNPSAKNSERKQSAAAAQPQPPTSDVSFYYPAGPVQQMPRMRAGYGILQYPGQQSEMYYIPEQFYVPGQPLVMYYISQYPQQQQMVHGWPMPHPPPPY